MNPGWRVLDCSTLKGSLKYRRGQLVVSQPDPAADSVIPLSQIAVILVGSHCSISGAVLQKLSDYDIALLVCDWRNVPVAAAMPWNDHSRIAARQRAQASLSLPRRKQAWSRIISAKISGQARAVSDFDSGTSTRLHELSKSMRSGDPDNKEAQAARLYWSALSGTEDFLRLPGSGQSGWNAALDYGYTLLRGHGIRSICSAGLSGTLGVFHKGRGNAFALVDDLMEPFRPVIDHLVFTEFEPDAALSREHKHELSSRLQEPFTRDGKSLPTVFEDFAQSFGLYVEGNEKALEVPRWEATIYAGEG